jgi:hypothetical protein
MRGVSGPVKPVEPNFSTEAGLGDEAPAAPPPAPVHAPAPAPPPPDGSGRTSMFNAVARAKARPHTPVSQDLPGIAQPALVIGIGQLGVDTLSQLRQRLTTEFGEADLPHLRMVVVDTDPDTLQQATASFVRASLRTQETLLTRLQRPSHFLKGRDGKLCTDSWLNSKLLHRIPRDLNNAGLRPLGRLAFVDNYRSIARRLEAELVSLASQDTPCNSDSAFDLGVRTTRPRVYIVTSLAGNTGSGMFLDVAYLVRKLLGDQGHADAEIVGVFYLPSVRRDVTLAQPLANTFAALTELQYYCQPNTVFSAHYETAGSTKGDRVTEVGPAFQRCILMRLPEPRGKISSTDNSPAVSRAGDFLYRDLTTALGQAIDAERHAKVAEISADNVSVLQAVGLSRILWPRLALMEDCARRLATQLVARWMNKDAKPMAAVIGQWTEERWESLGLRSEGLIERFQQLAEQSLQQKPETLLAEILALMNKLLVEASAQHPKAKGTLVVTLVPVVQAMECLERVLGIPEESRTARQVHLEPSMIEQALEEIAHQIADECEQKLAELAVTLLEDPEYRLAGAEEALRQFCATVEHSLRAQETLAKELSENAAQLHQRIQKMIDTSVPSAGATSTQWTVNMRRATGGQGLPSINDLCELVRTYSKTRYHSLVLTNLNQLYVGLRGHLSDQLREVGFCRARIAELNTLLQPPLSLQKKPVAPVGDRALFPTGCIDLRDSIEQVSRTLTADDLVQFDARVQEWIKAHCEALLEICMGSSSMVRNLAPAILQEAERYIGERVQGASVAEMYLTRKRAEYPDTAEEMIFDDLQRCLDEATPEFGRISAGNEISIVTLPNDESGQELAALLQERMSGAKILLSERQDEMIFYHELINIQWKDLDQLGPIAQDFYHQRCAADPSSLHTREDVFEWQMIAESR